MNEDRITGQRAGWQDIATAPRDGSARLVWCPRHQNIFLVSWRSPDDWEPEWWLFGEGRPLYDPPTMWHPLPPPPDTADDIPAGLEALSEPIVAEWGEVKDRLNLGKED